MTENPPERQLNIRITPEQDAEIREAAKREMRSKAGFGRILFFWAWEKYREAGTLQDLIKPQKRRPDGHTASRRTKAG